MKREYKFSSILWIMLIGGITNYLLSSLVQAIDKESFVLNFIISLVTGLIGFVFTFSISGGLLRNRMGSVGDYLNQVNYINMKVVTVGFIIAVAGAIVKFIGTASGTVGLFKTMINPSNSTVFALGSIVLAIVGILVVAVVSLFFAYSDFYLADHYDTEDGVMEIIGKIFTQGKMLFKKTLILSLKFYGIPFFLLMLCIGMLFFVKDEMVGLGLFAFIGIIFAIGAVILTVIYLARLSDIYLDDKLEIEA